jgi:hypothetical protein
VEWIAFEQIDGPILIHEHIDLMGAWNSYITAKSHGAKNVQLKDFLPKWDRHKSQMSPEALGQIMEAYASQPSPHSSST